MIFVFLELLVFLKFSMNKKLIISLALLLPAAAANAQFHFGGQVSINFDNERTSYNSGVVNNKENAYIVSLKPKLYWNINDKMQVGGRIGFAFGRLTSGTIYDSEVKDPESIVNRAVGWSICPFYGYKFLSWKRISVWGEANVFFGRYYNTDQKKATLKEWGTRSEYGFQLLPVVSIDLTEKLALQVHLGIISLGWYGTSSNYADRVVTTSSWDVHKGGLAGIAQGLADYGIGVVKKF